MNIVSKNKDSSKTFPDSFKLLINTYTIKNSVRFYLFCIYYLRLKKNIEEHFFNKEEIEEIYISAKNILNKLNRFAYIYKFKKYKNFEYYTDLNFVSLKNYHDKDKIQIIQNKTIYNFKIRDLINLWKISLKNSEQMFPLPKLLKNPFTNIELEKHHLYNIFFKYTFAGNLIPEIILFYFKSNFNLHLFKMEAHEKLQTNAISKFIDNGPVQEQFDYLTMLLHDFRKSTEYVFFKTNLSIFKKLNIIKKLKRFIKYYLIFKFNTNMLKKEYFEKKIKEEINNEIKLIKDDVFIRLTPEDITAYDNVQPENDNTSDIEDDNLENDDVQDDDDEEEILLNRNTSSTINNGSLSFRLNSISNSSISRRSSYPRFLPPIVTNTYNNNINNTDNMDTSTNPFSSTFELPRTPTNNTPENTIVRRFNLGFR
tara:strand:- start:4291 stop:5565 length:1275 start_codon:yes stop_codon:yes gene_type:complete